MLRFWRRHVNSNDTGVGAFTNVCIADMADFDRRSKHWVLKELGYASACRKIAASVTLECPVVAITQNASRNVLDGLSIKAVHAVPFILPHLLRDSNGHGSARLLTVICVS